jgi:dihydrofolate reductase
MGHPVILGRRTWDSIGRPLPGRRMIVLTGQQAWSAPGVEVAHSLDEALGLAGGDPAFVAGGETVYRAALPRADALELTRVHAEVEGDSRFPGFDPSAWRRVWHEDHPADASHAWPFTFERYEPLSA